MSKGKTWEDLNGRVFAEPERFSAEPVPYAHEYGKSNGDGTFSVVIERGDPKKPVPDWPVKPLYALASAPVPEPAPRSTAPEAGKAVDEFAKAILHGDDEHRAWLTEAAVAFNAGEPLPPPRGKGTAPAPPFRADAPEGMVLRKVLAGEPNTPPSIAPLAWLREAIEELKRRGPDSDCEDPDAFWTMVNECEAMERAGKSALASVPAPSGAEPVEIDADGDEIISPYEWLAQEFERLAVLRKMWTALEVAAIIRRHDIERKSATEMQPPAGETIRTTQDGSMEAAPVTGQSPASAVSTPCGLASPSYGDCQNMKEVGGGMEGERYRCAVCGKGYFLDYEDMK